MTSPTILRCCASGHCVMRTNALSSLFPPINLLFGMRMSCTMRVSCVTRKAMSLSTRSVPTNVSFARCRISKTCASRMWFRRRAISEKRTRSPFCAHSELRSETKIGLSVPSGTIEFLPFNFLTKRPSCTCPPMLRRKALSPSFFRKSSHAISSNTLRASIFSGCVLSRSSRKISFSLKVVCGLPMNRFCSICSTSALLFLRRRGFSAALAACLLLLPMIFSF